MDIESFRDFCLAKTGTEESFPFDDKTIVFKVMGKMYALAGIEQFKSTNLKCDPEYAIELRADYNDINPGFHMNKKHWNTVTVNGDVMDQKVFELIEHSYDIVVKGLTKKLKVELAELNS